MLKIVPTIDFCGGCEDEALFKRYYDIENTDGYEYHPSFTDLTKAIDYVYRKGQTEIIIDLEQFGPLGNLNEDDKEVNSYIHASMKNEKMVNKTPEIYIPMHNPQKYKKRPK